LHALSVHFHELILVALINHFLHFCQFSWWMDALFFVCRLQILWSLILHGNFLWSPDVVLHAYPSMYATISAPPQRNSTLYNVQQFWLASLWSSARGLIQMFLLSQRIRIIVCKMYLKFLLFRLCMQISYAIQMFEDFLCSFSLFT